MRKPEPSGLTCQQHRLEFSVTLTPEHPQRTLEFLEEHTEGQGENSDRRTGTTTPSEESLGSDKSLDVDVDDALSSLEPFEYYFIDSGT